MNSQRQFGRPEFIPREIFRHYISTGKMNKLFCVDGILPGSLIARWEREGKPIRSVEGKFRPLDVVAKARALGMKIEREREEKVKFDLEKAREELASLNQKIESAKHSLGMNRLSHALTSKVLLTESEIIEGGQQFSSQSGVYFLIRDGRVVYVGQSVNIHSRIATHIKDKEFDSFSFIPFPRWELDVAESLYIHALRPEINGRIGGGPRMLAPLAFDDMVTAASAPMTRN